MQTLSALQKLVSMRVWWVWALKLLITVPDLDVLTSFSVYDMTLIRVHRSRSLRLQTRQAATRCTRELSRMVELTGSLIDISRLRVSLRIRRIMGVSSALRTPPQPSR